MMAQFIKAAQDMTAHFRHENIIVLYFIALLLGVITAFSAEKFLYCGFLTLPLLLLYIYYKNRKLLLLLFYCSGILAVYIRINMVHIEFIEQPQHKVKIQGVVEKVTKFEEKYRLILSTKMHGKLRITTLKADITPGDYISCRGNIFPPQEMLAPMAFDFRFYFYFKRIRAVGYCITPPKVRGNIGYKGWATGWRQHIEGNIREHLPSTTSGIILSLITGNANQLSKDLKEKIRNIGIAHVFAISGMHMGIVIAIAFFSLKYLVYLLPSRWLLWVNINKISALIALAFGYGYLVLADFTISAERAYIMCFIVLWAIILDRQVDPLRNLFIAGMCLLFILPETSMAPSLQMSFSAVLGLVLTFHYLVNYNFFAMAGLRLGRRFLRYVFSLIMANITANLFTLPFTAFHFQKFSLVSFLANIIVIPFTEFILMPLCMIHIILSFFGANGFILLTSVSNFVVNSLLLIIDVLAGLEMKLIFIPKFHHIALLAFIILIMLTAVLKSRLNLVALPLLGIIFVGAIVYIRHDFVYHPKTNRLIMVTPTQINLHGKFSGMEQGIIEDYYNKPVSLEDLSSYLENLSTLQKQYKVVIMP